MPRLKRVAEKKQRQVEQERKSKTVSSAGRILANKKWATKDEATLKKYYKDLAFARSKRKKRPTKFDREQKSLANIQKMRDAAVRKKQMKEKKKKDEEVREMKIAKKNKKKAEADRKKNSIVRNTTLFDEPAPRRSTRTRRKPK